MLAGRFIKVVFPHTVMAAFFAVPQQAASLTVGEQGRRVGDFRGAAVHRGCVFTVTGKGFLKK